MCWRSMPDGWQAVSVCCARPWFWLERGEGSPEEGDGPASAGTAPQTGDTSGGGGLSRVRGRWSLAAFVRKSQPNELRGHPMTQAVGQPAGPEPAPDRDWLERYEPLRPLGRAYWTRSLLCRDRRSG